MAKADPPADETPVANGRLAPKGLAMPSRSGRGILPNPSAHGSRHQPCAVSPELPVAPALILLDTPSCAA